MQIPYRRKRYLCLYLARHGPGKNCTPIESKSNPLHYDQPLSKNPTATVGFK